MPLTSKNDGPALAPGDIVRMDWVVARTFPTRFNVVRVARTGSDGSFAGPPPASVAMRVSTRPAAVEMMDGLPMAEGNACRLLWQIAQVFPETGTVRVTREGLFGQPGGPLSYINITTGARAEDLELVPPETALSTLRETPWRRTTREDEVTLDEIEPEMLPFGFEPEPLPDRPEALPPVLTSLVPSAAQLGTPSFSIRVLGSGFDASSSIIWNGAPEPTTYISPSEVRTLVNMATATTPATIPVAVQNLAGLSNALSFTFTPAARSIFAPPLPPRTPPRPRF